jgi:hypothetical protein
MSRNSSDQEEDPIGISRGEKLTELEIKKNRNYTVEARWHTQNLFSIH